jgi:hypothetical protein
MALDETWYWDSMTNIQIFSDLPVLTQNMTPQSKAYFFTKPVPLYKKNSKP